MSGAGLILDKAGRGGQSAGMDPSAADMERFYGGRYGQRAARVLTGLLAPRLLKGSERRFLALGYPAPLLAGLRPGQFERLALLVTCREGEGAGAGAWPPRGSRNCAAVGRGHELPFSGSMFDQALAVHALEHGRPAAMLAELNRVIAPAGELLLIVPNRAGALSHFERTPFGAGRPFGRGELTSLLEGCGFVPRLWRTALAAPPVAGLRLLDTPLTKLARGLGGVHFIVARKSGGAAAARVTQRVRAERPALAPAAPAAARARP